jgi:hydroxymethylbilane synthase
MPEDTLRLGTRGSLLARTQSMLVADALERAHPGLKVEMVIVKTTGDAITDRPLHEAGGKGLFTKELEQALLAGDIDFAVHSYKDVPVTMPLVDQADLVVAAVPAREDPRDVLASPKGRRLQDLPAGARVGTGSMRRRCQILALRPDLVIEPIRGNIDTRLKKMHEGRYDAVVLALAGLKRTRLMEDSFMSALPPEELLPAPGQGALALQCRRDASRTLALLGALDDPATAACVNAEREVVRALEGDCHSPIAALATVEAGRITLRAAVGGRGGALPVVSASGSAGRDDAPRAVAEVYQSLLRQGVQALLAGDR